MALEGTIRDFGLPDIFQLIGLQRKTGLLTLTNDKDKETVTVTFENGMVVMADSSARRLEDRLGNVLVKQGKITRERLDEALGVQKQTLQRLGHILATSSAITTRDLRDALQVQISQIVFRVFRWRDGRYLFNAADSVDFDRENFVPMSADFILMEGIRMVDEWPIIEKKIPSLRHRVPAGGRPVADRGGRTGTTPEASARIVGEGRDRHGTHPPGADEERVFRKVDGVRTVQAIIDATGSGEFEVCRTLFDFLNRNLIAPAGRGSTAAAEEAGGRGGRARRLPGYAVAGLVSALALAGFLVQRARRSRSPGSPACCPATLRRGQDGVLRSRLGRLERAIEAWRATHGAPPAALDELVGAGLVEPALPPRPVGAPVSATRPTASGYLLSAIDESGAGRPAPSVDRPRRPLDRASPRDGAPADRERLAPPSVARAAVTVGNFDGVHRGHQALVARPSARARETGGAAVVLTFDPHPARVLRPERGPGGAHDPRAEGGAPRRRSGIDRLVGAHSTRGVAGLSPEAFAREVLASALGARHVVVGESFRFGHRRRGRRARARGARRAARLRRPGGAARPRRAGARSAAAGCATSSPRATCARRRRCSAGPTSSTRRVVRGDGRGRAIGVPTANLAVGERDPARARRLRRPRAGCLAESWRGGVVNLGERPDLRRRRGSWSRRTSSTSTATSTAPACASTFQERLRGEQRFAERARRSSRASARTSRGAGRCFRPLRGGV